MPNLELTDGQIIEYTVVNNQVIPVIKRSGVPAGTYSTLTVNEKGHVTAALPGAEKIRESGRNEDLIVGDIRDGQVLMRSGASIIGTTGAGSGSTVPSSGPRVLNNIGELDENDTNLTYVQGYYSPNDGGGGWFVFDQNMDKSKHDGGLVIDATHPNNPGDVEYYNGVNTLAGCWLRIEYADQSVILTRHYGMLIEDTRVDHILNKIFKVMPHSEIHNSGLYYGNKVYKQPIIRMPSGRYTLNDTVFFENTFTLTGNGMWGTVLHWAPTDNGSGANTKWAMRMNPDQEGWTRPKYSSSHPTLEGANRGTNFQDFSLVTGKHNPDLDQFKRGLNVSPTYWLKIERVGFFFFYEAYKDFAADQFEDGELYKTSVYVDMEGCIMNNNGISINSASSALYMTNCALTKSWQTDFHCPTHPDFPLPPAQVVVRSDLYITNTNLETMPGGHHMDSKTDDYAEIRLEAGGRVTGTLGKEQATAMFCVGPYNSVNVQFGRFFGHPHIIYRDRTTANVDNYNGPLVRNIRGPQISSSLTANAVPLLDMSPSPMGWLGCWHRPYKIDPNEKFWSPFGCYVYDAGGTSYNPTFGRIEGKLLQSLRGRTIYAISAMKFEDISLFTKLFYRLIIRSDSTGYSDYLLNRINDHTSGFWNGWRLYSNNLTIPSDIPEDAYLNHNISCEFQAGGKFWWTDGMFFIDGIDLYPVHGKYRDLLKHRFIDMKEQSGQIALDMDLHNNWQMQINGSVDLQFNNSPTPGSEVKFMLEGPGQIAWPANIIGQPPTDIASKEIVTMLYDGADYLVT